MSCPRYGDLLKFEGKSFTFWEFEEGGNGDCIAEAVDEELDCFNGPWSWCHMYGGKFRIPIDECEVVSQHDPQTFQGMGI